MSRTSAKFRVILPILLFATLQAKAGFVGHPRNRVAVEQIERLENQWREAQLSGDVPAMDRLLSDDFLGITAAGSVVTKTQQLERMRARKFTLREFRVEDSKIKLAGKIAIVTSLAVLDGSTDGTPMKGSFRYTRVYRRSGSGLWRITSFEATPIPRQPNFETTRQRGGANP